MGSSKVQAEKVVERMLGDWKRGMLSFWALSLLLVRPSYGLEIAKEIEQSTNGNLRVGASTIYQLLRRLEKRGLVESRWQTTTQGPPRAYYETTLAGREVVRRFVSEILAPDSPIAAALNDLMPRVSQKLAGGQPPN